MRYKIGIRLALAGLLLGWAGAGLVSAQNKEWQVVAGDANHDGLSDLALINEGEWYVWMSSGRDDYEMRGPFDNNLCGGNYVIGDLDGDSQADIAMLSGADWYYWLAADNYAMQGPIPCGVSNGLPYLHDFDWDRRSDPCVVVGYDWHVWLSGSNYAKRVFGFNPNAAFAEPAIPIAWDGRRATPWYWQLDNYYGYHVGPYVYYRGMHRDTAVRTNLLTRGIPVIGQFDRDESPDVVVLLKNRPPGTGGFWYSTYMSGDRRYPYRRRGPWPLDSGRAVGVAGMVWRDAEGCYAAASVYDVGDITNALVDVNGAPLDFYRELSFNTSKGYTVSVPLPFYFAELPAIPPGGRAVLTVRTNSLSGPSLMYRSASTPVPDPVRVLEPAAGSVLEVNQAVPMSWTAAAGSAGYLVSYDRESKFAVGDEPLLAYVRAPQTRYMIPINCIQQGDAEFGVLALNGDVQRLLQDGDTNDNLFVAASWGAAEAMVEYPPPPPEFLIVKQYKLREQGLTFDVRESDPYRMSAPGRITVDLKSRKRRLSVAFVAAYDMEGNPYFAWQKARIYKRKSKWYSVTFPCQVGTTLVIGTHDFSYCGTRYDF